MSSILQAKQKLLSIHCHFNHSTPIKDTSSYSGLIDNTSLLSQEPTSMLLNVFKNRWTSLECPKISLKEQQFRCPQCEVELDETESENSSDRGVYSQNSSNNSLNSANLCQFTGYTFCNNCMSDKPSIIPRKILADWDWQVKVYMGLLSCP